MSKPIGNKDSAKPDEIGDAGDEGLWHAVDVKSDCPHVLAVTLGVVAALRKLYPSPGCADCGDKRESWYCLACGSVECGRYINGHALKHFKASGTEFGQAHPLYLSSVDLSVWCYLCDSYIEHPYLYPLINIVHEAKFGSAHPQFKSDIEFEFADTDNDELPTPQRASGGEQKKEEKERKEEKK